MGGAEAKCGKCCNVSEGKGSEILDGSQPGAINTAGALEEVKVGDASKNQVMTQKAHDGGGGPAGAQGPLPEPAQPTTAAATTSTVATTSVAAADSEGGTGASASPGSEPISYPDGSTFQGQLKEGKRHGQGIWTSVNGQYEGSWQDDYQWGYGKQVWADGRVYTGHFQKGKFHGAGRMEWHTAQGMMVYEGQYSNDTKEGTGRFAWPDGRVYDGEWQAGKRWGKGTYVNAKGEPREGIWNDDKLEKWADKPAA